MSLTFFFPVVVVIHSVLLGADFGLGRGRGVSACSVEDNWGQDWPAG